MRVITTLGPPLLSSARSVSFQRERISTSALRPLLLVEPGTEFRGLKLNGRKPLKQVYFDESPNKEDLLTILRQSICKHRDQPFLSTLHLPAHTPALSKSASIDMSRLPKRGGRSAVSGIDRAELGSNDRNVLLGSDTVV